MSKIYPYGVLITIEEIIKLNKSADIAEMIAEGIDEDECCVAAEGIQSLLDAKLSLFLNKFGEFIRQIDSNLERTEDTEVFKNWVLENFKGMK
jgi:hypothetical protein